MIGFWIFMLVMDLLVPSVMIGFGKLFLNKAPQNINYIFGYRTAMSMKNQDTWQFAHRYCGKLWVRLGWILVPLSVIPMLFVIGKDIETIANVGLVVSLLQLLPLVGSIFPTEIALKKAFDKNGQKKQHKQERRNHAEATGNPMEQKNLRRICSLKRIADNQSVKQRTLSLYGEFY